MLEALVGHGGNRRSYKAARPYNRGGAGASRGPGALMSYSRFSRIKLDDFHRLSLRKACLSKPKDNGKTSDTCI